MSAEHLSPAMIDVLLATRSRKPVDGRSWRAIAALERRGLVARACYHPLSCSRCQGQRVACGEHYAGSGGVHRNCTGDPGTLTLTPDGRLLAAETANS